MAAKKLGLGRSAGTGKIDPSGDSDNGAEKWTSAVKSQLMTAQSIKGVLSKTIPMDYISVDPDNPRKLAINHEDVVAIARRFPLDLTLISSSAGGLEDYIDKLTRESGLTGKALGDLLSIVEFAAALKTPERLINPISVRQQESKFLLIAGERRFYAHIFLQASHITSRIFDDQLTRAEIDLLQWEENVHREDMNLWERVERVAKIIDALGGPDNVSAGAVATAIGKSRAEASRYLAVVRCPHPELLQAIKHHQLSDLKKATKLATLPSRDELLDALLPANNIAPTPAIKVSNKINSRGLARLIELAFTDLGLQQELAGYDMTRLADLEKALATAIDRMAAR